MTTIDRTVYYGARIWFRETVNTNPAYRQLSTLSSVKVLTRTRTGVSLPKHKEIIAAHQNATTVLSGTFMSLESQRGRGTYTAFRPAIGDTIYAEVYGDIAVHLANTPGYIGGWPSVADSRAASKFLSAVRAAQVAVSGPTFLGEIKDTIRMFRKPAGALQEGIQRYLDELKRANAENKRRYFNKRKPAYLRNLSHIASGLWLERSFGWLPLLNDINDARTAYNNLFEIDRVIYCSGGGHDAKLKQTYAMNQNIVGGGYLSMRITGKLTEHDVVRYRGAVHAQAVSTARDRLAQYGFTPSEFIPAAWEVLPWSFLADYFVNIGDLISAAVTDTANVAWVNRSHVTKADLVQTWILDRDVLESVLGKKNLLNFYASPGFARWRTSTVGRGPSGVPTPSLSFYLPRSDGRLLNIASLLTQVGIDTGVPQRLSGRTWRN